MLSYCLAALALTGLVSAAPAASTPAGFTDVTTGPSRGGRSTCISGVIKVEAEASNMQFHFTPVNQTVITQALLSLVVDGANFMKQIGGPRKTVSGTYDIYSHLCFPKSGAKSQTVQFLTHGVGFDSTYWDFAPGYSYVDAATAQGYTTFSYDRLGQGRSSKPDPIQVTQAPLEVAIARGLVSKLRNAEIDKATFSKVIGVGHSYGSIISQGVTEQSPRDFDATVLTGFTTNLTGDGSFLLGNGFEIASQTMPHRFSGLQNGYLASGSAPGLQTAFYKFPGFDPKILQASYEQEGTVAIGEFLTQTLVTKPSLNYLGPVAIVNGLQDLPFCNSDCTSPSNKGASTLSMLYPASKVKSTYYAPDTGHGLNLHYNAAGAYSFIAKFLKSNGFPA